MANQTTTPRPLGRPREERADRAILAAAIELIAEQGVRDLRMDDVADRARVGKATIYRRYRSKDELVTAAVAALVSEITVPDTGSTRADLARAHAQRGGGLQRVGRGGGDAQPGRRDEPRCRARARASARGSWRGAARRLRAVLERGVERGDLRADLDLELALDVLGGPLFYRLLITGGPIDRQLADGVVELILRGFAPAKPARRQSPNPKKEVAR